MAPLTVSIAAAIISAFSAWISTRQLFRVQRTRLGELVDEISRADAEYDRILLENDFRIDEGMVSNHELRTEVLARQALELVEQPAQGHQVGKTLYCQYLLKGERS